MGSFNTSCFVSNQVIKEGDKVVLFPIVPNRGYSPVELQSSRESTEPKETINGIQYRHSNCYANANFDTLGMFLTGEYADYGRFDLDDTPENRVSLLILLDTIKSDAYITLQGDNDCHDHPFNPNDLVFDKDTSFADLHVIWETITDTGFHEDRIFLRDSDSPQQLSIGVICKHAADSLIQMIENLEIYEYGSTSDNKYKSYTREQWTLRAYEEYMSKDVLFNEVRDCYRMSSYGSQPEYLINLIKLRARKSRWGDESGSDFVIENVESEVISDAAKEKIMFLLNMSTTYYYMLSGVEQLGIRYSPQVYTGQDYGNEQGDAYVKFVTEVNAKIRIDNLRDEDEDDEEE